MAPVVQGAGQFASAYKFSRNWSNVFEISRFFFDFSRSQPSATLDLFGALAYLMWTICKEYLMLFITVQNFVATDAVVSILWFMKVIVFISSHLFDSGNSAHINTHTHTHAVGLKTPLRLSNCFFFSWSTGDSQEEITIKVEMEYRLF